MGTARHFLYTIEVARTRDVRIRQGRYIIEVLRSVSCFMWGIYIWLKHCKASSNQSLRICATVDNILTPCHEIMDYGYLWTDAQVHVDR